MVEITLLIWVYSEVLDSRIAIQMERLVLGQFVYPLVNRSCSMLQTLIWRMELHMDAYMMLSRYGTYLKSYKIH